MGVIGRKIAENEESIKGIKIRIDAARKTLRARHSNLGDKRGW